MLTRQHQNLHAELCQSHPCPAPIHVCFLHFPAHLHNALEFGELGLATSTETLTASPCLSDHFHLAHQDNVQLLLKHAPFKHLSPGDVPNHIPHQGMISGVRLTATKSRRDLRGPACVFTKLRLLSNFSGLLLRNLN